MNIIIIALNYNYIRMTHQRNKSIKESMKIFDQYFEVNYFLFYLILSDLQ